MDARRFTGQKTVAIWVQFGPNYISETRLLVSAYSRADIVCNPGQVQFDTVPCGQTPSRTFDVEYAGDLGWQVTKVTTSKGAPFDATVKEAYRLPGGVGYRVTVTLKADAAPGPFRGQVILDTNDPDAAQLPVPVEGTVKWPHEVLSLGTVKVGEALTRWVTVRGNKPFVVLGIEGPEGVALGGEPNVKARPVHKVALRLQPAQPGAFRYEIKIKTDLQDAPMIVVIDGVAAP
jgi:hypothetical protein